MESTFIELLIPNRQNHLIGLVYKHPSMKHKFNNDFMNTLLEKLKIENKPSIIIGNFNLNLIKYMHNTGVNRFLENILSNNFISQITFPQWLQKKEQHWLTTYLQTATNTILIAYQVNHYLHFWPPPSVLDHWKS